MSSARAYSEARVPDRPAGRPRDKSRRRSSTAQKLARFQLTAGVIMESIAAPAGLPGITAARTMRPVSNLREVAMLGIPMRYLLNHPATGVADLLADPIETWTTIHESYVAEREQRRPQCPYEPDPRWEERLHEKLGVTSPCEATREFLELWPQVIGELEAKGIRPGPESFQWWNDGDAALVRAIWCLTRHLRPRRPSLEHRSSAAGTVLARRDRRSCWRGPCRSMDLHQGIEQAPPSRTPSSAWFN
jgi:hypothetical protein